MGKRALLAAGLAAAAVFSLLLPLFGQKARSLFYSSDSTTLGLSYIIEKLDPDGSISRVAPDQAFRSGDRFRFQFQSNHDGFLYLIHEGSSGSWKVLFPSGTSPDNAIAHGKTVQVPNVTWYKLDEMAGIEKLIIVLTKGYEQAPEKAFFGFKTRDLVLDKAHENSYAVSESGESVRLDLELVHQQ
ncbi:MAG: DUF4384 domain-containing protein [Acidobacteria bacterium]|nr:MAG: DUF4384 domain-containing protein [Acidobacteriota bacterium]